MSVRVVYDFDPSEHYRASRVVAGLTRQRWIPWVFVGVSCVLVIGAVWPAWGKTDTVGLLVIVAPYLLIGVFWLSIIPLTQRLAARNLLKRDASARGPQERTVDAAGYHSRGNGVALDIPWHAMARAIETDEFFLLFYNKQLAYYLPKRAFAPEVLPTVRSLIAAGLGERARVLE